PCRDPRIPPRCRERRWRKRLLQGALASHAAPHSHQYFARFAVPVSTSFIVLASYNRPPSITRLILSLLRISAVGSASSTTRSASLPGSIEPMSLAKPSDLAESIVPARSAS